MQRQTSGCGRLCASESGLVRTGTNHRAPPNSNKQPQRTSIHSPPPPATNNYSQRQKHRPILPRSNTHTMFGWLEKILPFCGKVENVLERVNPTHITVSSLTTSIMADARARRSKGVVSYTASLSMDSSPLLKKIVQGLG